MIFSKDIIDDECDNGKKRDFRHASFPLHSHQLVVMGAHKYKAKMVFSPDIIGINARRR